MQLKKSRKVNINQAFAKIMNANNNKNDKSIVINLLILSSDKYYTNTIKQLTPSLFQNYFIINQNIFNIHIL